MYNIAEFRYRKSKFCDVKGNYKDVTIHFFTEEETSLDVCALLYLTQYFTASLNGNFCAVVTYVFT